MPDMEKKELYFSTVEMSFCKGCPFKKVKTSCVEFAGEVALVKECKFIEKCTYAADMTQKLGGNDAKKI